MTLLEALEFRIGPAQEHGGEPGPPVRSPARPLPRRYRGVRNAGFARLEALERRAMASAAGADAVDALQRQLEAVFSEARAILAEQIAELDHCLKQAQGLHAIDDATHASGDYDKLTGAEKRVFAELASGKPNKIIAYDLGISEATVKAHVSKILKKLKVHSRNRAIALFGVRLAS